MPIQLHRVRGGQSWVLGIAAALTLAAPAPVRAGTLVVTDVAASSQNLSVGSLGDTVTTPSGATWLNYVVGPSGLPDLWSRAIVPFPRAAFAGIADGRPILGVRLSVPIVDDFAEPGESFASEIRLFSTAESDLIVENANIFAAITGDGGDYTVIGSLPLVDGDRTAHVIDFPPEAVQALESAIQGTDAMIGIAFREFAGTDDLDEFVFGVPPGVVAIEVTADAVVPPFCDVETTAPAYRNGQIAGLARLRLANPDFVSIGARFLVQVTPPGVAAVELLDTTVTALPGRFDRNLGPGPLFAITSAHPRGSWSVRCAIEDPASGDLIGEDSASFQLR